MALDRKNAGKRIELISTPDPYTKLSPGSQGTILWERFDGYGNSIAVDWDSGSTLTLLEGDDRFRIL